MPLYYVQDPDRPVYTIARTYGEAVDKWKMLVSRENAMPTVDVEDPIGVSYICDDDEFVP